MQTTTAATPSPATQQPSAAWQTQLKQAISHPAELFERLSLDTRYLASAVRATKLFPLRVPHAFISRMQPGRLDDPLLRQVLPLGAEFAEVKNFTADPLHERDVNPVPSALHKYQSRLLLITTGACAVHCRYCFRREFAYGQNQLTAQRLAQIDDYLEQHPAINEVILSGGDPLMLSDQKLQAYIEHFSSLRQLTRLRLHTRLPVVLPDRLTDQLIATLQATRLNVVLVIHCNHPNEIDSALHHALSKLQTTKITVLNQSVLLRGVNDNVATLAKLSDALFAAGVLPYYLHALDPVTGTAHFAVSRPRAEQLFRALQGELPGFLVPKWVTEQAGLAHKLLLA